MVRSIIAASAALLLCLPVAVAAQTEDQQIVMRVVTSDLDLAREAGRLVLTHRIHRAARRACSAHARRDLGVLRCVAELTRRAQPAVNAQIASAMRPRVVAAR